jgi:hypothetical protein
MPPRVSHVQYIVANLTTRDAVVAALQNWAEALVVVVEVVLLGKEHPRLVAGDQESVIKKKAPSLRGQKSGPGAKP